MVIVKDRGLEQLVLSYKNVLEISVEAHLA